MSQIRPGLECSTSQLKRLDAVVAGMNAAMHEGAPRHSRQSVLEGVEQNELAAELASLEKEVGTSSAMVQPVTSAAPLVGKKKRGARTAK
jgi:hypothetical protein